MPELLLLATGIAVGVLVAIPVGPIALLVIRRTIDRGAATGYGTGLGAAMADAVCGVIATLGVKAILDAVDLHAVELKLGGGLFLLVFAAHAWFVPPRAPRAVVDRPGFARAAVSGLAFTLGNPLTLLGIVAVFASFGLAASVTGPVSGTMLIAGMLAGSFAWWSTLVFATARVHHHLGDRTLRRINRAAALLLAGAGVYAFATAGLVPPAAAQQKVVISVQPSADWKGLSVVEPGTGAFSYCAVERRFEQGLTLAFARNAKGETNIAVGFPEARLKPDAAYPVALDIDGGTRRRIDAYAADPLVLVVPTGADGALASALRKGKRLNVEGPNDIVSFALAQSGKALDSLAECVRLGVAGGAGKPESSGGASKAGPGAGGPGGDGEPSKAARRLPRNLEALLSEAGLVGVKVLEFSGEAGKRPMDFAWIAGPVFGGIKETRVGADADTAELILGYLDELEPRCDGKMRSDLGAPETIGPLTLSLATIACETSDKTKRTEAALLFYRAGDIFAVFFHEAPAPDGPKAVDVRDRIARVLKTAAEKEAAGKTP